MLKIFLLNLISLLIVNFICFIRKNESFAFIFLKKLTINLLFYIKINIIKNILK